MEYKHMAENFSAIVRNSNVYLRHILLKGAHSQRSQAGFMRQNRVAGSFVCLPLSVRWYIFSQSITPALSGLPLTLLSQMKTRFETSLRSFHGAARAFLPITTLAIALALIESSSAAMLEGAEPKNWPADPEKHTAEVQRVHGDKKQEAMIAAAEAAQPDPKALREAAAEAKTAVVDHQWWYKMELDTRIPFAITGDAVEYYLRRVENNGKQTFKRYMQPGSSVNYQASVAFHKEFTSGEKVFQNVHVVTLKLKFSQNFVTTQTEGMFFSKERVVVLDEAGKVLHITGDGPTEVPIFAI